MSVLRGDCVEVMAGMEPDSVDALVTDPPYGLEFMGKEWDRPWSVGFSEMGIPGKRMAMPSFGSSRNPMCRTCRKHERGAKKCQCDTPAFDETPATASAQYGEWCRPWATAALRVAKPGAYLLAFGGDRTVHRMTCALEDAGWIIRGMLMWGHSQGFPKGRNVTRDLEQALPADARCACAPRSTRTVPGSQDGYRPEHGSDGGRPRPDAGSALASAPSPDGAPARSHGDPREGGRVRGRAHTPDPAGSGRPSTEGSPALWALPSEASPSADSSPSGTASSTSDSRSTANGSTASSTPRTSGSEPGSGPSSWSPPSEQSAYYKCTTCGKWAVPQGLNTALKPAFEPIVWAQKPMRGNYAANVAMYGTGALNIDACRIGTEPVVSHHGLGNNANLNDDGWKGVGHQPEPTTNIGRYPSNVILTDPILDGGWEGVIGGGWQQGGGNPARRGTEAAARSYGGFDGGETGLVPVDTAGTYSRFFLIPKAPTRERVLSDGRRSPHPTQKPEALIRHLVTLVTPPGGLVLDPFLGSGTLGVVCDGLGMRWQGIEREPEYADWAEARIADKAPAWEAA